MTTYDAAYTIGEAQGASAATWVDIDSPEAATALLTGINDGDPAVPDTLPAPDLAGQWADAYTSRDLCAELDVPDEEWETACEGYEEGFSTAVEHAVAQRCTYLLEDLTG